MLTFELQRQTVVSQFFQLDRLVVEGGMSVSCLEGSDENRGVAHGFYRESKLEVSRTLCDRHLNEKRRYGRLRA